ncbi:protein-glutamate O-methyltransferase CheR [Allopontixanthobacter sp.]|uniref:CheR family methyltransferase n=1 Tax=Allopontixanthobacter sp. TaxID=2906452 RepID=UPI002AB8FBF4|nr:protein-glutamate O-methyltransferase CheR [Allopontixanthobacter sp.]MDZ4306493.1 protein-glutamate O-methyltransferase CheR [Allopontixanthobacter sp.]
MEVSAISHRIIADLLTARSGQQLTESRRWRITSALGGIFRDRGITNTDQLVCLLAEPQGDQLAREVVEALLNNETYFFRDRVMFELLDTHALPALAKKRAATKRLSIWSAGCSTGQEALSLAMMFVEQPQRWAGWQIEIVGTDVSAAAIKTAKRACYSQFEIQRGLGISQMIAHFEETAGGWQAKRNLQRMIRFKVGNMLEPTGDLSRYDLVLCRNVLLYFDEVTRERAFKRIAQTMAHDGLLMLGAGETTVGRTGTFKPSRGMQGLYTKAQPDSIVNRWTAEPAPASEEIVAHASTARKSTQ